MKTGKIKLDVNALSVESFEAAEAVELRGTVRGHEVSEVQCANTKEDCTLPVRACYGSVGCISNETWCFYDCGESGYWSRVYPVQ
jgi:hypothetical protein